MKQIFPTYDEVVFQLVILISAFSFISIFPQLPGLAGQNGILQNLQQISGVTHTGLLAGNDLALQLTAIGGCVSSLFILFRVRHFSILFVHWLAWWALISSGGIFTVYIWDIFLSEVLFILIFSGVARFSVAKPGFSVFSTVLLEVLLFRLMLGMGLVKFLQGSDHWLSLKAMLYFYPNQPMPAWPGWWLWQLPKVFHSASVLFVFFCEIIAPFLMFTSAGGRVVAGSAFVILQVFIFVSGNYGIFNLLTIAVSMLLFDKNRNKQFSSFWHSIIFDFANSMQKIRVKLSFASFLNKKNISALWFVRIIFLIFLSGNISYYTFQLLRSKPYGGYIHESSYVFLPVAQQTIPDWLSILLKPAAYFFIVNPYALFGNIPEYRMELRLWASQDNQTWYPYQFKARPSAQEKAPIWYAPFFYRLDHAFYYESFRIRAPLLHARQSYFLGVNWLPGLLGALMFNSTLQNQKNSTTVSNLFAHDPFAEQLPPRYFKLEYNFYEFCTIEEFRQSGCYWKITSARKGRFFEKVLTKENLAEYP